MAERLTTGLAGLDAQLGGGVPAGSIHVLVGEPMNALELFTYHFAAGGTSGGGGTVYVTADQTPDEVRHGIRGVGGRPDRVKVEQASAKGKLPPVLKGARYVFDGFSQLSAEVGFDKAFALLGDVRNQIRTAGTTALITLVDGLQTDAEVTRMRLWADGAMELGFDRQGFGLYPFLKVTKMRGVPDSARFLLFKETEKGLFMESTRRVF